jgi:hypothetical protein
MDAGDPSRPRSSSSRLVGREAERALIAARLDDGRGGGAAILVRGPAGIGKSALVDDAVRRAAPSTRILRTVGTSPETGLGMAGLYQLLLPLLPLAHLIPGPRQEALRVAFGVVAGAPPEPFAVAMAALDLLVDAAAGQPLQIAEGNPLALVELPKTPGLTVRSAGGPGWLPLTQRFQAAFAARVDRLPPLVRTALNLLALHDSESLAELLAALGAEGIPARLEALEPAIAAGLVQLSGDELRFRHGLMRSAVYNVMSPSGRVAGHLALARAVGPGTDRGILHRARAATGYDEAIAAELELVADRAAGRGAVSAAVTTLARAAELTTSAPRKRRYLFRAAALAYQLGQTDVGNAHRAVLALLADDERSRLLLEELAEMADMGAGGGLARLQALVGLAERSRRLGDDRLAGSFLHAAAYRCWTRQPDTALARTMWSRPCAGRWPMPRPPLTGPIGSPSPITWPSSRRFRCWPGPAVRQAGCRRRRCGTPCPPRSCKSPGWWRRGSRTARSGAPLPLAPDGGQPSLPYLPEAGHHQPGAADRYEPRPARECRLDLPG